MRAFVLAACALLAACGQRQPTDEENDAFARDLVNLSTPKEEAPPAPEPAPNLLPLQPGDIEAALGQAQRCDFTAGGQILFAAAGRAGVARINGLAVRLGATLPAGATGGFFEGERFAISVGRLADGAAPIQGTTSWPAKLILTERVGDRAEQRIQGAWRCPAGLD